MAIDPLKFPSIWDSPAKPAPVGNDAVTTAKKTSGKVWLEESVSSTNNSFLVNPEDSYMVNNTLTDDPGDHALYGMSFSDATDNDFEYAASSPSKASKLVDSKSAKPTYGEFEIDTYRAKPGVAGMAQQTKSIRLNAEALARERQKHFAKQSTDMESGQCTCALL
eukprot:CAMPEP_0175121352 /NCGR_PEP_ID=MMETSP0087-20121206/1121_1 /TAXON_ID=136419 /ORGANISM="Unknown Unknown, Strain D1" /LENGTH=164 /DNA_ID=CAMNT_0016402885 /DNA_START=29 /DNA_END=523 /DNA_ORIENTATION=-